MTSKYSKIIGYSPLSHVDHNKLLAGIRTNKKIIDEYFLPKEGNVILVAGAGSGMEASIIKSEFQIQTIGIDLNIDLTQSNESFANKPFELQIQDLHALAFNKNSFSLIYCYHVLEHVTNPIEVLSELSRVLLPGGVLFIGFPNKHRLFSYIGTSQKATPLEKIKWNINDYKFRLQGKFENKFGAHAGFTEKEFINSASEYFETIIPKRNIYMLLKYSNIGPIIAFIIKTKLEEIFFPSNYFICIKKKNDHEQNRAI
jgi:ubiquinone/menaquinone biosynthesis C-methylase UbiE